MGWWRVGNGAEFECVMVLRLITVRRIKLIHASSSAFEE